jgi:Sec-independent protein translocase protein TatA
MKITKTQLQEIVKAEVDRSLNEALGGWLKGAAGSVGRGIGNAVGNAARGIKQGVQNVNASAQAASQQQNADNLYAEIQKLEQELSNAQQKMKGSNSAQTFKGEQPPTPPQDGGNPVLKRGPSQQGMPPQQRPG